MGPFWWNLGKISKKFWNKIVEIVENFEIMSNNFWKTCRQTSGWLKKKSVKFRSDLEELIFKICNAV